MHYGEHPILQSVRIELAVNHAIGREPQAGRREVNEVFKGLGLDLEVMGAQVHPLVPHHLGKMLHCSVDHARLGAGMLRLTQREPALL